MINLPLNTNGILFYFGSMTFEQAISLAAKSHRRRFGTKPNTCYLNSDYSRLALPQQDYETPNVSVKLKPADTISPDYLWVAKENE